MINPYRIAPMHILAIEYDPFRYCGKRMWNHGAPLFNYGSNRCNLAYAHMGACDYIIPSSPHCKHPWACYDSKCGYDESNPYPIRHEWTCWDGICHCYDE